LLVLDSSLQSISSALTPEQQQGLQEATIYAGVRQKEIEQQKAERDKKIAERLAKASGAANH